MGIAVKKLLVKKSKKKPAKEAGQRFCARAGRTTPAPASHAGGVKAFASGANRRESGGRNTRATRSLGEEWPHQSRAS